VASEWYLRRRARAASERGRQMGLASGEARQRRALESDGPVRGDRVVRITVEDSLRPTRVIVARQFEQDEGRWSRFHVQGRFPVSASGLGALVAGAIDSGRDSGH
jgi:hypothetical protein